ncbi:MAG: hypothetical protein M0R06_26235 [Sphaerochaeta sp.]|jgi:hypothetical protein|nr:hypothetical protein [Sphaerochaeta sp.]
MSKTWLVIGAILATGAVVLCAMDKMPSDVVAAALIAAIDRIFEKRSREKNDVAAPQP